VVEGREEGVEGRSKMRGRMGFGNLKAFGWGLWERV